MHVSIRWWIGGVGENLSLIPQVDGLNMILPSCNVDPHSQVINNRVTQVLLSRGVCCEPPFVEDLDHPIMDGA